MKTQVKILKRRGMCIHGCGRTVLKRGSECRKCRRTRRIKGLRIQARIRKAANKKKDEA